MPGVDFNILNNSNNMKQQYISDREKIEEQMIRFDQLHTVAEMAASMAHEVRSPMTTVRGLLQLLGDKEECRPYKDYFDLMIEELDGANAMISEYLSLTKIKPEDLSMQNLNNIIKTMYPLLNAEAVKREQEIILDLDDIPDSCLAMNEIRRLIINLVRNGLEAMESGKQLSIITRSEDGKVILSIVDQGHGIPADIKLEVGTPFFTTKEHGTGLGLSVCYQIAAHHGASIDYESDQNGTSFSVSFLKTRINNPQ